MRIKLTSLLLSAALALSVTPAHAHAQLQKAVPSVGGTVSASPSEIRLQFSEGVEPHFSTIALATEAGAPVEVARAATDPADRTILIAKLGKALKPGIYEVTWHVVSVDTHRTQGSFRFSIAP